MITTDERIGREATINSDILEEASKDLRCAVPGIVDTFDPVAQTVSCKIAIREKLVNKETGSREDVEISVLTDVPVVFPHTAEYALTLPIKSGDEVLIVFSDLCINSWWANGGVGNQEEIRRHDLSDAIAIPGPSSQPKVFPDYNPNTVQLRNKAGDTYVEIDGTTINIISEGDINITAKGNVNVKADGDVNVEATNIKGEASANIDMTAGADATLTASNITATASGNLDASASSATITASDLTITAETKHIGNMDLTGNLTVSENLTVGQNLTVGGDTRTSKLYINGKDFDSHTHGFQWSGESGLGNTGTPN